MLYLIKRGCDMQIFLENETLVVLLDDEMLQSNLVRDFIDYYLGEKLVLRQSIIFLHQDVLLSYKEIFLENLGRVYAKKYNFSQDFFIKSLLKLKDKILRFDLDSTCNKEIVDVDISFNVDNIVKIKINCAKHWLVQHLYLILRPYVKTVSGDLLLINIQDINAKKRLQKFMSKKLFFYFEIIYNYENSFFDKLFDSTSLASFSEHSSYDIQKIVQYYSILDCHIGAPFEILRKNYKKLAKAYHPDRVCFVKQKRVVHYTNKFQILQEAYTSLQKLEYQPVFQNNFA